MIGEGPMENHEWVAAGNSLDDLVGITALAMSMDMDGVKSAGEFTIGCLCELWEQSSSAGVCMR